MTYTNHDSPKRPHEFHEGLSKIKICCKVFLYCFILLNIKESVAQDSLLSLELGLDSLVHNYSEIQFPYHRITRDHSRIGVYHFEADEFNKGIINHPLMLIQGKVPGLQIYNRYNDPNGRVLVRSRGSTSFLDHSGPLLVVDGSPNALIENLDPKDIQSITVVNDGSMTAIFGTKASYGVILIETKLNNTSGHTLEVDAQGGISQIARKLDVANRDQFVALGGDDFGSSTDWTKEISQYGLHRTNSLSLSLDSIGKHTNLRLSLNNRNTDGVLKNHGYNRWNARLSVSSNFWNDRLRIDFSGGITDDHQKIGFKEAVKQGYTFNPTVPILAKDFDLPGDFDQVGGYSQFFGLFDSFNPVAIIEQGRQDHFNNFRDFSLSISADITKKLSLGVRHSRFRQAFDQRRFHNAESHYLGNALSNNDSSKALVIFTEHIKNSTYSEGYLRYKIQSSDFNASFLYGLGVNSHDAIFSNYRFRGLNETQYLERFTEGFEFGEFRLRTDSQIDVFSNFALAQIDFSQTFFLDVFWRVEEDFRVFFGEEAGHNFGVSTNLDVLKAINKKADFGLNLLLGMSSVTGVPDQNNPIRDFYPDWESKREWNIGFEADYKNTYFQLNYYNRKITDILGNFINTLPETSSGNFYNDSFGEMNSSGIEFLAQFNILHSNDFKFNSNINISTYQNSTSIDDSPFALNGWDFGSPGNSGVPAIGVASDMRLGTFFGPEFDRIGGNGIPTYVDQNGDGAFQLESNYFINENSDNTILEYALPSFEFGWNNHFSYKSWTFSSMIRGAFGHSIVNSYRLFYEPSATSTTNYIVTDKTLSANERIIYSSYHVEKANFIKLDNLTISKSFQLKHKKQDLVISLTGQNLLTFTNYTGASPEPVLINEQRNFGMLLEEGIPNAAIFPGIERRNQYFSNRIIALSISFPLL